MKKQIFIALIFLFGSYTTLAQELPPPTEENLNEPSTDEANPPPLPDSSLAEDVKNINPDDFIENPDLPFTGTLEEAYEKEEELFGPSDEDEDEDEEEEPEEIIEGTHNLKIEFTSLIQFLNPLDPSPYLENEYTNVLELSIFLLGQKKSSDGIMSVDVQNWGYLAQNEFFDCRLEVNAQEIPVEITSRLKKESAGSAVAGEESDEEDKYSAVIKVDLKQDVTEDWFSFCTDISGAVLNTQGAPENYNMQVLRLIEPKLNSLVFEDFIDEAKIDLVVPLTEVDDTEINNIIILSGEGTLTLSPL